MKPFKLHFHNLVGVEQTTERGDTPLTTTRANHLGGGYDARPQEKLITTGSRRTISVTNNVAAGRDGLYNLREASA